MRRPGWTLLLGCAVALAACQREGHDPAHAPDDAHIAPADADHGAGNDAGHEAGPAAGHDAHADGAAHEALPLRPIMQRLGASMAGLTSALWLEDYAAMEMHAAGIAGHSAIAPEELARIEAALGAEMDAFDAADVAVHEASVRLHAAVEARDLDAVVARLGEVQVGCVACHTQFRERLRTASPAP